MWGCGCLPSLMHATFIKSTWMDGQRVRPHPYTCDGHSPGCCSPQVLRQHILYLPGWHSLLEVPIRRPPPRACPARKGGTKQLRRQVGCLWHSGMVSCIILGVRPPPPPPPRASVLEPPLVFELFCLSDADVLLLRSIMYCRNEFNIRAGVCETMPTPTPGTLDNKLGLHFPLLCLYIFKLQANINLCLKKNQKCYYRFF